MAAIDTFNTEKTELDTALDAYSDAKATGDATTIDNAKQAAITACNEYTDAAMAVKAEDPNVTVASLLNNPKVTTELIDAIKQIVRTGFGPRGMLMTMNSPLINGVPTTKIHATGPYNIKVDWGDGNVETFTEAGTGLVNITHVYDTAGTEREVTITGSMANLRATMRNWNSLSTPIYIKEVKRWGNTPAISNFTNMFRYAANLIISATDSPTFGSNTSMSQMFYEATNVNINIAHWKTGNVTDMSYAFAYATGNIPSLDSWDVSKVTTITQMFSYSSYNQPLNSWNTSSLTAMNSLFLGHQTFNQPLNNWDTSKVTNMYGTFRSASAFNQPLNNWDTGNVTHMGEMFYYAAAFNQDISMWDTSKVGSNHNSFSAGSPLSQANTPSF